MATTRRETLEDLIHWRRDLPELRAALRRHTGPATVTFTRSHAAAALERTIAGLAIPSQLAAWTQAVHFEEDVDINDNDLDLLTQFLLELSTPELFTPVTLATCQHWLVRLRSTLDG
ncbi:hypothetical protein [Streptomyces alkaliterrae]|uniref:Uncharacterized protein n=1 Tax=Streptomyces alkaliterrae TaxID=2213162 RepID=A0A5P0YQ72_9ACTN|nr:hypothetical protein [Streptomyces alkaliterrae]MBB1254034.1 hypothetical protein [Streptomyces alkaliterrae]MBB1260573.1 hypothetical protein [Streptomyces alkaliterrae]MQS01572.1 hypothetical protein [Streptomyces alkaliterrae]